MLRREKKRKFNRFRKIITEQKYHLKETIMKIKLNIKEKNE